MRHNAVRDTLAEVLREVCKDVRVEPQLLPVTGERLPAGTNVSDGARSDVSAVGLWQPLDRAFLDIRVFNPLAPSNANKQINAMYLAHENSKKREYNSRILEVEKDPSHQLSSVVLVVALLRHLAFLRKLPSSCH